MIPALFFILSFFLNIEKSVGFDLLFFWQFQLNNCSFKYPLSVFDLSVNFTSCNKSIAIPTTSGINPQIAQEELLISGKGDIFEIDFEFFEIGDGNLFFEINGVEIEIKDKQKTILDEMTQLICGQERYQFFSVHLSLNINQISPIISNSIPFKLKKDSAPNISTIGIKFIKISRNCKKNCDLCLSDKICETCFEDILAKMISKFELVCELQSGCSPLNCKTCWKGADIEICASCFQPYVLNDQNNCIFAGTPLFFCANGKYQKLNTHFPSCYEYSYSSFNQDLLGCFSYSIRNYELQNYYKCETEAVYYKKSQSLVYCSCQIKYCESSVLDYCSTCISGYSVQNNNKMCVHNEEIKCQKMSNYQFDKNFKICRKNCSLKQYYDFMNQVCINCMEGCNACNYAHLGILCSSSKPDYYIDINDHSTSKYCSQADSLTCHSINCSSNFYFESDTQICVSQCPRRQFGNRENCVNCPINCATCYQDECYSCEPSYYLDPSNPANCLLCKLVTDLETCSLCSGYQFDSVSSSCIKACKIQQYYDFENDTCTDCKFVTSELMCSKCYPTFTFDFSSSTCILECFSTQFYDFVNFLCKDCSSNCESCSSSTENQSSKCKTCTSGFQVDSKGECQEIKQNQKQKSSKIKVNNLGYILELQLSQHIFSNNKNIASFVDISISTQPRFYSEIFLEDENLMIIHIKMFNSITNAKAFISISDKVFSQNRLLAALTYVEDLPDFIYVSESNLNASDITATIGNIVTIILVSSILIIIISGNFYILMNTFDITGYLYYLLFLDIRFPRNVIDFFSIFKNFKFSFIPNMFENAVDQDYTQHSPQSFNQMHTDLYFLKNVGQTITIWVIVIGIYILGKILIFVPLPSIQIYLKKFIATWEWSLFFDIMWATYIYALIGVLLQFYFYDCDDHSCILNYLLHSICFICVVGAPFLVTWLIGREKDIKNSSFFMKKLSTLVGGVKLYDLGQEASHKNPNKVVPSSERKPLTQINSEKEDLQKINSLNNIQLNSNLFSSNLIPTQITREFIQVSENGISKQKRPTLIQNSSICINSSSQIPSNPKNSLKLPSKGMIAFTKYLNSALYFRKVLFSIVIVFANGMPYFQLAWNITLMLLVLSFHLYLKPLTSKYEQIKNCVGEICLIIIYICAMILIDDSAKDAEEKRIQIGWAMIAMSEIILVWHAFSLLMEVKRIIFSLLLKFQKNSKEKKILPEIKNSSTPIKLEEKEIQLNKSFDQESKSNKDEQAEGSLAEKVNLQLEKREDQESQNNEIEPTQKISLRENEQIIKLETKIKSSQVSSIEKQSIHLEKMNDSASQSNHIESSKKIFSSEKDEKFIEEAKSNSSKAMFKENENIELEKIKDPNNETQNNQIEFSEKNISEGKDQQVEQETKNKSSEVSFEQKEDIQLKKIDNHQIQHNKMTSQTGLLQSNINQFLSLYQQTNPTIENEEILNCEDDMYAELFLGNDMFLFVTENQD